MAQIIPAILATSEEQYQNDLAKLHSAEALQGGWIHIDFADTYFVQNEQSSFASQSKTIGPEIISKFPSKFRKEAHLMVDNPNEWIEELIKAGFERVIFHLECKDNINETIEYIKSKGLEAGIALKNETELEKVEQFIEKIDILLLMGVKPGLQGQPFIEKSINKLKEVKSKGLKVRVGIDGGIKNDNIKEIVLAGADFVIVGSYLLKGDIDENLESLWEAIYG
ncbi:MAG: ribulose-phosphate 3-epimerase [Microgenomates group bacterium Gr01-1014_7]|nr:MAG: ribulose-phosphate 3-epimerase [Microgenomates group bacterium Gr01-1014_7]